MVGLHFAVGGEAVQAVEFEEFVEVGLAEEAFAGAFAHVTDFHELQVLGDEGADAFGGFVAVVEAVEDGDGHFGAEFGVAVEADALGLPERRGLGDIVEEDAPSERRGGFPHRFQHKESMGPDVAFGVELGGLLDALHGLHLGQDVGEEEKGIEEFEAAAGVGFGENSC